MGTLLYGPKTALEIGDRTLFHLDVLLKELRGRPFQLQVVGLSGAADGNMLSLMIGPGVSLSLEFYNGPDLDLDYALVKRAEAAIERTGCVTIPFDFDGVPEN